MNNSSPILTSFIQGVVTTTLGFIVAIFLYKWISPNNRVKALDYGRLWAAWVVALVVISTLPRFFLHLDVESFALVCLGIVSFGGGSFRRRLHLWQIQNEES